MGSYAPPKPPGKYRGAGVGPSAAYSYSAAVAEVEVDPETGIVRVPTIWIAHDIGRSINPALVMGQVEGSVYMGLGEALMEEMVYRENRKVVHKFPSMLEYKSPTTWEMAEVITYLVEASRSQRPVRRQGSRTGSVAADHASGRERDLRCGGGAGRRGADEPAQGAQGATGQGSRTRNRDSARSHAVDPLAGADLGEYPGRGRRWSGDAGESGAGWRLMTANHRMTRMIPDTGIGG